MHGDGLDAHFTTGTLYAQGNFATIGYDDFFEHVGRARLDVLPLIDDEQSLSILDGFAVLHANRLNHSGYVGFDLVHHLHRLDDAQGVAFTDTIPHLHIRCGAWRR